MVLRWIAAGMGEAAKQFRRVNGYLYLPALRWPWTPPSLSHRPRRMPPDQHRDRHRSSTAVGTSSCTKSLATAQQLLLLRTSGEQGLGRLSQGDG